MSKQHGWRLVEYRGTWCAYIKTNGQSQRISLRTKDRAIAEQAFSDFIASLKKPAITISDMLDDYLLEQQERAKRGAVTAQYNILRLKPFFGNLRPDQITRSLCQKYAKSRTNDGVKPGTIRREMDTLRAAIKFCAPNSGAVFEKPPAPPPRDRWLTRDELSRLLDAAGDTWHLQVFIHIAIATAARKGAILELTWDQIDFARREIKLRTDDMDGRKGRPLALPMTDSLAAVLDLAYQVRTCNQVIEYAGKPVMEIKGAFNRAAARAGMPDVTPHILRHTAAVWMASAGVPMAQIAQFMGHKNDIVTQQVYARFAPDHHRPAIAALEIWTEKGSDEPFSKNNSLNNPLINKGNLPFINQEITTFTP